MNKPRLWLLLLCLPIWVSAQDQTATNLTDDNDISVPTFIDVAHRGASGYLPEHTQAATAFAHALGADYIEQDVQLSRDGVPVVLHDLQLDAVSNVADVFPERHRPDGHYYVMDFTLNHLKQLSLRPRRNSDGQRQYLKRFPSDDVDFRIQTLGETIALIKGLNKTRRANTGIYIEIKSPRWYKNQDYDPTAAVMQVLEQAGYQDGATPTPIYLQSFDPEALRRLKREFHVDYPLVQLVAANDWNETDIDYDALRTYAGMESLSSYADAVGLWLPHVLTGVEQGEPQWSKVLQHAEQSGLDTFVFTLRADQLPTGVESHKQLRSWLQQAGVSGAFSDFVDKK